MTRRDKAILALVCAAEIINCAKVGVLKSRIVDLKTQRDIYASRAQHWIDRAVEDEEVIDSMQLRLDALADGKVKLEDAGAFFLHGLLHRAIPAYLRRGSRNHSQRPANTGGRNRGGGSDNLSVWHSFVH